MTQAAFIVLARRAGHLRQDASVAGFLHQTTVYAAKNALRAESRRRRHEGRAAIDPATPAADANAVGDDTAVAVDRALARLRDADRHLLMLHYFDGLTLAESAAKLAITHEAARKRLHRALERLRDHLHAAGVTMTTTAVPAAVAALARPGVEAKAAAALASTALAGGAQGSAFSLAHEVLRTFQLLALKKAAAAAIAVATVVCTGAAVAVSEAARPVPESVAAAPAQDPLLRLKGPSSRASSRPLASTRIAPPPRPTSEAAGMYIVDYAKVFDAMQRTMAERARLDAERTDAAQQNVDRVKLIAALRQKVAATAAPAERAELENRLRAATEENALILRSQQANLDRSAAQSMLEIFKQIESAIQQAAQAKGVNLPPEAFPPYPADVERMAAGPLRQYLLSRRRLRRPAQVPDLTDAVRTLLNPPSTRPASAPAAKS